MWKYLLVLFLIYTGLVSAAVPESFTQKNINYQTYMGQCPTKSSSMFAMAVMREFEKERSLKDVKERIIKEKLDEKFFLSDYRIDFNPVLQTLRINLECPEPLAKVQVYKSNGEEHYSAILGDNARLYEPGFEVLMKVEKKLTHNLPMLALTLDQINSDAPTNIANFISLMDKELRNQISEILINKNNELTIVFAFERKATSVFMGADLWEEKLTKLSKIIGYVSKNKRYPSSINLVNAKKVVVKFSDSI